MDNQRPIVKHTKIFEKTKIKKKSAIFFLSSKRAKEENGRDGCLTKK